MNQYPIAKVREQLRLLADEHNKQGARYVTMAAAEPRGKLTGDGVAPEMDLMSYGAAHHVAALAIRKFLEEADAAEPI